MMLSDLYAPFQGGIERHVQSLSKGLVQRGHSVVICTVGWGNLPKFEEEKGVRIYRLEGLLQKIPIIFRNPNRRWHIPACDLLVRKKLAQVIEKENPQIIQAHGWIVYSMFPLKKVYQIPLVYTIHDHRLFCPRMTFIRGYEFSDCPSLRNCIACMRGDYGLLRAWAAFNGVNRNKNRLGYVDRFVAVSSYIKEAYKRNLGIVDRQIEIIPNFYEPASIEEQYDAQDLPEDFILYVGWLMPHKGLDVLIKAYRKINTKTPLVVIGIEHPDYIYRSTPNVCIIKNAPHNLVMNAMSMCRFVVVPSISPETASTVVLEAWSKKKAVVASRIGGLSEQMVDGKTGILVPPNNESELARSISLLLKKPELALEMGEYGFKRFVENFMPDTVFPRIMRMYENLLK